MDTDQGNTVSRRVFPRAILARAIYLIHTWKNGTKHRCLSLEALPRQAAHLRIFHLQRLPHLHRRQ